MAVVRTLRAIPWRVRMEIVRVVAIALVVELALRRLPLPRVARLLGVRIAADRAESPLPDGPLPDVLTDARRRREFDAAARVMRHWPARRMCLRRSLVLGRLLRDLDPALRLGVARSDDGLLAHAWIEVAGVRLDSGEVRFVSLVQPDVGR